MIKVEGYKAFKGIMKVYTNCGEELEIEGSWLYRPDTGNWYCQEEDCRYMSSNCEVVEDWTVEK